MDDGRADSPESGKTDFQRLGHKTSLTWDEAKRD
jgi:hypothetical protein